MTGMTRILVVNWVQEPQWGQWNSMGILTSQATTQTRNALQLAPHMSRFLDCHSGLVIFVRIALDYGDPFSSRRVVQNRMDGTRWSIQPSAGKSGCQRSGSKALDRHRVCLHGSACTAAA